MTGRFSKLSLILILTILIASFASVSFTWAASSSTAGQSIMAVSPNRLTSLPDQGDITTAQPASNVMINDIVGATYDPDTGDLIVIGQMLGEDLPTMDYEYVKENLVVALRAVREIYPVGIGPGVTIDPIPDDENADHIVKYFGNITNTHYGYVYFEADRLLKTYTLGKDNLGINLNPPDNFSSVGGYKSFFNRWLELNDTEVNADSVESVRWWFTPSLTLRVTPPGSQIQTILFNDTQVILNHEITNPTSKSTQAADAFVNHFSNKNNYKEFAREQRRDFGKNELYELPQLFKLYGIANWVWIEDYPTVIGDITPKVPVLTTKAISLTDIYLSEFYGGIETVPPSAEDYVPDPFAQQTGEKLLADRPDPNTLVWLSNIPGDIFPTDQSTQLVAMAFRPRQNLIVDHSFENNSPKWVQNTNDGKNLIVTYANSQPHWGKQEARLGDRANASDSIYQQVSIPANANNPILSYYWGIISEEFNQAPENDFFYAEILDSNGNLLDSLQQLTNRDKEITPTWHIASFLLDKYIGQTIRIQFRVTNSPIFHTMFVVDDVSLDIDPLEELSGPEKERVYLPLVIKNSSSTNPPPAPTATPTVPPSPTPTKTPTSIPTVSTLNFKVSFQGRDNAAGNSPQNVPIKVTIKNLAGNQVLFNSNWVAVTPAGSSSNWGTAAVNVGSANLTPGQTYQIFVRGAMHLAKQATLSVENNMTIDYTAAPLNPDGFLWACDINQDNHANTTDLTLLLDQYWGLTPPATPDPTSPLYRADQNGDGLINASDLIICNATITKVGDGAPEAEFTATPVNGKVPLTINFTDLSTGHITSRLWDFGDGNSSTQQNPQHTYTTAGSYTVTLTVEGPLGYDPRIRKNYITVVPEVANGDFELGTNGDWTETSTNFGGQGSLILDSGLPITPRSGSWLARLGATDNEASNLSQTVIIPANTSFSLHYWYQLTSNETGCGFDTATILVNSNQEQQYELCQENNTSGWSLGTIDMSAYAGQTVTINFRVETDVSLPSTFFVDDVSFEVNP